MTKEQDDTDTPDPLTSIVHDLKELSIEKTLKEPSTVGEDVIDLTQDSDSSCPEQDFILFQTKNMTMEMKECLLQEKIQPNWDLELFKAFQRQDKLHISIDNIPITSELISDIKSCLHLS